jgi:hypothetical protein
MKPLVAPLQPYGFVIEAIGVEHGPAGGAVERDRVSTITPTICPLRRACEREGWRKRRRPCQGGAIHPAQFSQAAQPRCHRLVVE